MTNKAIGVAVLCLVAGVYCGSQLQQPKLSIGAEVLQLDMSKEDALGRLSQCCRSEPLGNNTLMVSEKDDINHRLGMIYLYGNKVDGIAADRDWNSDPASYETGLAFYRLVDEMTHGNPVKVTLYGQTREASNGTSKAVTIMLGARRIRMEMVKVDPSEKKLAPQGVTVSECVGACSGW